MNYPNEAVKEDILEMLGLTDLYKNKGLSDEHKAELVKAFTGFNKEISNLDIFDEGYFKNKQKEALTSVFAERVEKVRSQIYATAVLYAAENGNIAMTKATANGNLGFSSSENLLQAHNRSMRKTYKLILETAEELANEIAEFLYTDYIDVANEVLGAKAEQKEGKKEEENPFVALIKLFEQLDKAEKEKQETSKSLPEKKTKTSFADLAKDFI